MDMSSKCIRQTRFWQSFIMDRYWGKGYWRKVGTYAENV